MAVAMLDIPDVQRFARQQVGVVRHRIIDAPFTPEQWEDLEAEAMAIVCELRDRYEHHRKGYDEPGSFAGYCSKYVPLRLTTVLRAQARRAPTVPLEHARDIEASRDRPEEAVFGVVVDSALVAVDAEYAIAACGLVQLLADGASPDEIARRHPMRLSRSEVESVRVAVASAVTTVMRRSP